MQIDGGTMYKIGFLGCGKIGKALFREIRDSSLGEVIFVQDVCTAEVGDPSIPMIREADEELYNKADLIIECATAGALQDSVDSILKNSDLLMFSVSAFSDRNFESTVRDLTSKYHHCVFIPHGAILGLDGIRDGRKIWEEVSIETTKNPKSLGREDQEKIVLYAGSTREACRRFPRNVNVHAAVALAGIGFDKTSSVIISDPGVNTNSHIIRLKGEGIHMQIEVSSFSGGGVTGKYTPLSACGSLHRILDKENKISVI